MSIAVMLPVYLNQLSGGRTLNCCGLMHHDAEQYENDELFARGRSEALARQRSFRAGITEFSASLLDSRIEGERALLHVQYAWTTADGTRHSQPGIHLQHWEGRMIRREDFWVGEQYAARRSEYFPDQT
ncbi:MAG: hypothetical protein R3F46_15570 [bacterium]